MHPSWGKGTLNPSTTLLALAPHQSTPHLASKCQDVTLRHRALLAEEALHSVSPELLHEDKEVSILKRIWNDMNKMCWKSLLFYPVVYGWSHIIYSIVLLETNKGAPHAWRKNPIRSQNVWVCPSDMDDVPGCTFNISFNPTCDLGFYRTYHPNHLMLVTVLPCILGAAHS